MRLLSARSSIKVLPRKISISILLLLGFAIARGRCPQRQRRIPAGKRSGSELLPALRRKARSLCGVIWRSLTPISWRRLQKNFPS